MFRDSINKTLRPNYEASVTYYKNNSDPSKSVNVTLYGIKCRDIDSIPDIKVIFGGQIIKISSFFFTIYDNTWCYFKIIQGEQTVLGTPFFINQEFALEYRKESVSLFVKSGEGMI